MRAEWGFGGAWRKKVAGAQLMFGCDGLTEQQESSPLYLFECIFLLFSMFLQHYNKSVPPC